MDGWVGMDGWMDGWKWMDGLMDGWTDGWMDGLISRDIVFFGSVFLPD